MEGDTDFSILVFVKFLENNKILQIVSVNLEKTGFYFLIRNWRELYGP